jgi:tetratricopeptide (TPR) repeat protein
MNQKHISFPIWYYLLPLLIGIITVLVYMPSWHYAFQFDDILNIKKHFNLRHYTLFDLFFSGSRWISYWLNSIHFSIGRLDPFSYRVGNIIIHVINGMFVFLVLFYALSRIKKNNFFKRHDFSLALMTSMLFLLHPVQTQTVSYVIQGELEGLATLSSLAALYLFLLYANARTYGVRSIFILGMYLVAFLSCGTKEITIVLPFLLILMDWFFVAQGSWSQLKDRMWLHVSIFALIFGSYLYLLKPTFFYDLFGLKMAVKNNIGNVVTQSAVSKITPGYFFISQFKVIVHYLWIFLWPFSISVEYDWKLSEHIFALDCLAPLTLLLLLVVYIVYRLKKDAIQPLCFGALWFIICVAPRSSFMPSPELVADYKTYLASIGWLFIIAAIAIKLIEYGANHFKYPAKTYVYIPSLGALLLAVPLGYCTMQRNVVWRSELDFWGNIIQNAPGKARAYNNYGVALAQDHNKLVEAIPYFQKAIALDQHYSDPCNNLAVIYARTNDNAAAIEVLKKSLRINPHYPEGYNNLASILLDIKEYDQAKKALEQALKYRPHYGKALFNLGRVYAAQEDHETAWQYYKKCCMQADMDDESGFNVYAHTSFQLKKYDDAIYAYKKVLEFNPTNYPALFRLGNAYFHTNNFSDALHWYHKAAQQQPQDASILYNIAETYAKLGNVEKAATYYEKIQHEKMRLPHVPLRLAECYRMLGKQDQAQDILVAMQKDTRLPDAVKSAALVMLKELHDNHCV